MTVLEKYQSMTVEEFADWLCSIVDNCSNCGYGSTCQFKGHCPCDIIYTRYREEFIKWLESEVDANE